MSPSRVTKLQVKDTITLDQWESALLSVLLQRRQDRHSEDAVDNLETVANITKDRLVIVFRKNISGIHQRLGEIVLKRDENYEVDIFSWVNIAATRSGKLDQELEALQTKYDKQAETIRRLNDQLENLALTKKSEEKAILEKCCELINSKKLKIREQQRLLSASVIDSAKGRDQVTRKFCLWAAELINV